MNKSNLKFLILCYTNKMNLCAYMIYINARNSPVFLAKDIFSWACAPTSYSGLFPVTCVSCISVDVTSKAFFIADRSASFNGTGDG